jgi:hypothetical protein
LRADRGADPARDIGKASRLAGAVRRDSLDDQARHAGNDDPGAQHDLCHAAMA